MSAQIGLLAVAMNLKPGQAYGGIPYETMAEAAIADMPILDRMSGARRSDVDAWIKIAGKNWGVEFVEDMRGNWTMYPRPAASANLDTP